MKTRPGKVSFPPQSPETILAGLLHSHLVTLLARAVPQDMQNTPLLIVLSKKPLQQAATQPGLHLLHFALNPLPTNADKNDNSGVSGLQAASGSEEPEPCGHPQPALLELVLPARTFAPGQTPLARLTMSFLPKVGLSTPNEPGASAEHP